MLKLSDKQPWAYRTLGQFHIDRNDYDKAIALYSRALDDNPQDASIFQAAGNAYVEKCLETPTTCTDQEVEQAAWLLEQALDLPTSGPEERFYILETRGVLYYHLGQYDRAIQEFDAALQIKADFWVMSNLAVAYQQTGQIASACEVYKQTMDPALNGPADQRAAIEGRLQQLACPGDSG